MQKAIAYYRVSTKRQGRSGLGLEAQQHSVALFAAANKYKLIEEFYETDSGARNGRLRLKEAIAECKRQDAILIIAKLDRLSRRVAFIASLMEAKVYFRAIDIPNADPFTLHIFAAVAEKERADNSSRTTAALAAAKARGVILGKFCRTVLAKRNQDNAKEFAGNMRPIIERIRKRGIKTIRAITAELNRLRIPTYRKDNTLWHSNTVYRLLCRIDKQ